MSLVITSNQDTDVRNATDQSIYSAYSYRNELPSTFKIPRDSQVCLQSAKVNIDGRAQLNAKNSIYYDWFGIELDEDEEDSFDESTSYPIFQEFGEKGKVLELSPQGVATKVQETHLEFHPNRKGYFECNASEDDTGDFVGFEFISKQNVSVATSNNPTTMTNWSYNSATTFTYGVKPLHFTRISGSTEEECVGIGLEKPLSLANGSLQVDFSNANASSVPWGVGLSRYAKNNFPSYFDQSLDFDDSQDMELYDDNKQYFEDIGVHTNTAGELVVRQAVPLSNGEMGYKEVEYYNNASSDLADADTRYDIDGNADNYEWIRFVCSGEKISIYIGHSGSTDLVTEFTAGQDKDTYPKPISQTMWCLHPVLSVGQNGSSQTNSLVFESYSGVPITGYNPTVAGSGGWFEYYDVVDDASGLAKCEEVDFRDINNPTETIEYVPKTVNASGAIDFKPAMIVSPSQTYKNTELASTADLFGFRNNSVINDGTTTLAGGLYSLQLDSSTAPDLSSTTQSIFIRLRNFGQQVLNARAKTKSTIIAQLPTADETTTNVGKLFYEPNRDVWLDLNNAQELVVSDFNVDLIYVNEQYAKVLEGQTIVVLYFRPKPSGERSFE